MLYINHEIKLGKKVVEKLSNMDGLDEEDVIMTASMIIEDGPDCSLLLAFVPSENGWVGLFDPEHETRSIYDSLLLFAIFIERICAEKNMQLLSFGMLDLRYSVLTFEISGLVVSLCMYVCVS